ncbi:MAG TPA: hypothetical protein VMA30_16970 [Xanthobacteraceae bacterium]|nr:hypothetical protein [Xanthobacteraceae bacterium]
MSLGNGFPTSGLIDFLRESTEAALDLSKNLTAAHTPGDVLNVWTRFAEGQYSAVERFSCQLTGRRTAAMDHHTMKTMGNHAVNGRQANGSSHPATAEAGAAETKDAESAALLSDLHEQAHTLRSQMDALSAQVAALSDKLAELGNQPPKIKFSFGEPPHTGWTPSKVVVLGSDGNGNLIELPSTIEQGGFRYTGTPSFWIAIG